MEIDKGPAPGGLVDKFARLIYESMDALDPIGVAWDDLSGRERTYCVALANLLLDNQELLMAALIQHKVEDQLRQSSDADCGIIASPVDIFRGRR